MVTCKHTALSALLLLSSILDEAAGKLWTETDPGDAYSAQLETSPFFVSFSFFLGGHTNAPIQNGPRALARGPSGMEPEVGSGGTSVPSNIRRIHGMAKAETQ